MPDFVMQRNRVVRTTSGHILSFTKGQPIHVPPAAIRAVMEAGAIPVDDETPLPEDEGVTKTDAGESLDPVERKTKILASFEFLMGRNERNDFGADGKPHAKAVSQFCGFTVDARERNAEWTAYLERDV